MFLELRCVPLLHTVTRKPTSCLAAAQFLSLLSWAPTNLKCQANSVPMIIHEIEQVDHYLAASSSCQSLSPDYSYACIDSDDLKWSGFRMRCWQKGLFGLVDHFSREDDRKKM